MAWVLGSSTCSETMGATSAVLLPAPGSSDSTIDRPAQLNRPRLVVLSGVVTESRTGIYTTRSPGMRASFGQEPRTDVEIRFVYGGPSSSEQPLASGELRRQIGLRLRARNTCNLVYVMWHIEPSQRIEVSVKTNPRQSTHTECGDHGYSFIPPTWSCAGKGVVRVGEQHSLRATIRGNELGVSLDGRLCWAGVLPPVAFSFDGPAGVRSDNGSFEFTF
jgi:hypothetical protein